MCFKYLMRPVPVVLLLIAFTDQLSADGKGKSQRASACLCGERTFAHLGCRITARSTPGFLQVVRAPSTTPAQAVRFGVPFTKTVGSLRLQGRKERERRWVTKKNKNK